MANSTTVSDGTWVPPNSPTVRPLFHITLRPKSESGGCPSRSCHSRLNLSVRGAEMCQAQSDLHERPILRQISAFAYRMLPRPPPNARFANETLAVNTCALVVRQKGCPGRRRLSSTKFQLLSMVSQNTGLLRFDGVRFVEWKTAGNDFLLQPLLRVSWDPRGHVLTIRRP